MFNQLPPNGVYNGRIPRDNSHATNASVLWPARLSNTNNTRNGGNSAGNATGLDRALAVARLEVTRLLERVDVAKQAKDTEAAVNMGISAKRLNSTIDEAEKL